MARVNITVKEFPDLVAAFLFDKINNVEEVIPDNQEFNELAESMGKRGMSPLLMKYYLSMDPQMRIYYKRLKATFDREENTLINVWGKSEDIPAAEKEPSKMTKVAAKVLKRVLASKKLSDEEKNYLVERLKEDIDGTN